MLIVWGHYGREIGLLDQLAKVPIPQKQVLRAPYEKLAEFLIGLLSGIEYLSDLSEGAAPLMRDNEVAVAWGLAKLADASGVSKTLKACHEQTVVMLEQALETVSQPFWERAVADLRQKRKVFLLDADLTGRPVSSSSVTFPEAAFGYMDGEIRLGYQLAEICLQTDLYGRQWLGAQHHPGNTVSATCLLGLLQMAEQRLRCHPRRRTDLLQQRLEACQIQLTELQQRAKEPTVRMNDQEKRLARLQGQIRLAQVEVALLQPSSPSSRQAGPYSRLNRLKKQLAGWEGQRQRAQVKLEQLRKTVQHYQTRIQTLRAEWQRLQTRWERLGQENATQVDPPQFRIRLDAGFSSGENLTDLLELGYEVETKSANDALVKALQRRANAEQTNWQRVGKNAEMVAWTDYRISSCPYRLTVGLERFHTPKGLRHAVLIRSQPDAPTVGPDLQTWFYHYNGRQTIEAGNKEEKTTFKVQHLMCRSPAGIRIQALLTVFAANFIRWADPWVRTHIDQSNRRFELALSSPKRLVRVAANSPAAVLHDQDRVIVRFSPLSSFWGVVINLPGHSSYLNQSNDHFAHF
jgi:hypothetical protein